jgi:hypothetical protein
MIEGSLIMIPLPFIQSSVFAVPRSIAISPDSQFNGLEILDKNPITLQIKKFLGSLKPLN